MISSQDAILLTLGSLDDHRVEGKKKLQKLLHLLKLAGAKISADHEILLYGPFSKEIANAAEILVLTGKLDRNLEPKGAYSRSLSVYTLPNQLADQFRKWPNKYASLLAELNKFTTIELEVASTIGYFCELGDDEQIAINKTKSLKPTKSIRPVLEKAAQILELVNACSGGTSR